ncbi:MAG TPA: glycoside hydrolase family 88 protein [Tepidisphaeraceae bacterium]|nr:glycoside hydrolase family 88 protein [Tepidisphaeraceae bacterium]
MHLTPTEIIKPFEPVPFTTGLRAPSGVRLMGIAPDKPLRLRWTAQPAATGASALRVTIGIDDRACPTSLLHVHDGGTGDRLGTFEIRYSGAFKIQSMPLTPTMAAALAINGAELRLENATHLHLIESTEPACPVLQPHLLGPSVDTDPVKQFLQRMRTPAVRHPFGWLAGCVMDGQAELHRHDPNGGYEAALQSIFIDDFFRDGGIWNESPGARPSDGKYYGIEATLPVAQLARLNPSHPAVDAAIDFWLSRKHPDDLVRDSHTSTEGCYTIAWPMAVVARVRDRDDLRDLAIRQCVRRMEVNVRDGFVWQLVTEQGEPRLRHWCRGVGWYLLGSVRTLIETGRTHDALLASLISVIDGLPPLTPGQAWPNFIDDPTIATDSSGTAAIAAAITLGVEAGLFPNRLQPIADAAVKNLIAHLTPDGLLRGCSQENKGGEALQRSSYRVISQMGMGLLAQARVGE